MDHQHIVLPNKLSKKNKHYCHLCGTEFGVVKEIQQDLLLDLWNLCLREDVVLTSIDGIIVWVENKLSQLK